MESIKTELGKIYAIYNTETDDFDKFRVINKKDDKYVIGTLNNNYEIDDENVQVLTEKEYKDFAHDHTLLESDGIVSISNIIIAKQENGVNIKDICMILFPNDSESQSPDVHKPAVVARQAINNIFADMANIDEVGMSVSLNTLPTNYSLGDFMESLEVESSRIMHIYKIDTPRTLNSILNNEDTEVILKELYDMSLFKEKNLGHKPEDYEAVDDDCINGYCNSLYRFIIQSGFYEDFLLGLNIVPIDKELEENVPLDTDDKLLLITLCGGGITINKAVPLKFDYDINLDAIKMSYVLTRKVDGTGNLYIVPYTSSPQEIDTEPLYRLTEERVNQLHNRLANIVKAYDEAQGNSSISGKELLDFTASN